MIKKVDTTALKSNQVGIITFALLGFILNQPYLILFVGLVLALGTIIPQAALFKQIYQLLLKPKGLLKPTIIDDDPTPHQFSQGIGALFLLTSSALLILGNGSLGWALVWIVIVLAAVNVFFNFCAGCFIYLQLDKAGLMPHKE